MRQRARYLFESTLSSGTWPVILWLGAVTLLLIALSTSVMVLTGIETSASPTAGPLEDAWITLMRTLDPGTMSGDDGWPFRLVSLGATLTGILVVSSLIGLIASAIDRKVAELRKGRSPVVVSGHTLILGWSPKVTNLVAELVVANENQRTGHVVVLAPHDKVAMEDEIRTRVPDTRTTTVVCRTGQIADLHDLAMVNAEGAKSIIVVSPESDAADAEVVRAALALQAVGLDPRIPVIAELHDPRRARVLQRVTHARVTPVVSTEVIARITAQVCRHRGLSHVFQELLDFDGDEIYFQEVPRLVGESFATAVLSFDTSSLIGLRRQDGSIEVCPPAETIIGPGDAVIAISADDDTVVLDGDVEPWSLCRDPNPFADPQAESLLVLGWSRLGEQVLASLDPYLGSGSTALVVYDPELTSSRHEPCLGGFEHLLAEAKPADPSDPAILDALVQDHDFDHVIVLCHRHDLTSIEADAQTLVTLLLLRESIERSERVDAPSIVAELLDVHDVEIVPTSGTEDFVVSDRLTSLMLSQLSENVELDHVFRSFFTPNGAEIATRRLTEYAVEGQAVRMIDLVAAAVTRGELCIGYRRTAHDGAAEVVVNAPKHTELVPGRDDELIVVCRR